MAGWRIPTRLSFWLRMAHRYRVKKTACLLGQAVVSAIHCFQSVHSTMHTGAPGPRRPLDPALERHVLLMLSDFSSEGI